MYCPNCGARNNRKQNFCRYCGLHLQDIEKVFVDQLVFGGDTKRLKNLRNVRRMTEYARFLSGVMLVGGIASLIFFDAGFGKVLITAALLSFFLAEAVRGANGYLQRQSKRRRVPGVRGGKSDPVETAGTPRLIEDRPFTPVGSVVEDTTEPLFAGRGEAAQGPKDHRNRDIEQY